MIKNLPLKILLIFLLAFSLLIFWETRRSFVSAQECTEENEGETQYCGTCGTQSCMCDVIEDNIFCAWTICAEEPKPDEIKTDSWTEYKCEGTSCGDDILSRECEEVCTRTCPCVEGDWDCTVWDCDTSCETGSVDCQSWQICSNGTSWTSSAPSCQCSSSCLEVPQNPSPEDNAQKVKLPVTIGWDSVSGANSYRYKIEGVLEDYIAGISVIIDEEGNCLLKSNTNYNWGAKACCASNGTNCGDWSNWAFKTSLAPQPILPQNNATNVSVPVFFDWCDVINIKSYIIQIYKDGELRHIDGVIQINDSLKSEISLDGLEVLTGKTTYEWELVSCLNENGTKCGIGCSDTQTVTDCADFGQKWSFTTQETEITPPKLSEPFYDPGPPEEIPIVNLSNYLKWVRAEVAGRWARSYYYEIKQDGAVVIAPPFTDSCEIPFSDFFDSLELDTKYNWHVKSCYGEKGTDCSDFGDSWYFKTTGATPTNLSQGPTDDGKIIIPAKLDWDDMPEAASYNYEVASDLGFINIVIDGVVENAEVLIDYPNLIQETPYWWRVKTCADKEGSVCGDWSNAREFTTFKLESPKNPDPGDGDNFYTYEHHLKWRKVLGAKFYQYKIDYGGTEKIPLTIVSTNSIFLPTEQLDLGEYTWYVQACLDKDCNESSGWSSWSFTLVQPVPPAKFGLVPCGRTVDNPETPWVETESCRFEHIFLLLKNILDLLLWRIGLIILVLLAIATGVIFYFSRGAPTTMAKVKSLLKSAGIGYATILLAWIIINLILRILGFTMGTWWMLPF